jgi:hypothetical protein
MPNISDNFVALFSMVIVFMVPIVAILTSHQRKMAAIIHQGGSNQVDASRILALEQQVAELRATVHQQTIALDNVGVRSMEAASAGSLQDRLPSGPS